MNIKKILEDLLDWIYKKKCYFCGRSKECVRMCSECYNIMEHLSSNVNRIIEGKPVYCAGVYEKNLQKLIRGLKYHNQRDLAFYMAKFMYEYWQNLGYDETFQIVPVPIFPKRKKQRKYNHMDLVAEEFAKLTGYRCNINLVKRIKDTKPQYNLKKNERVQNLKDAFQVDVSQLCKGKILIIDDICTTGATFEEIIAELKKSGIDDIVCFAATTPFGD